MFKRLITPLFLLLLVSPCLAITWTAAGGCSTASNGTFSFIKINTVGSGSINLPSGSSNISVLLQAGGGGGAVEAGGGAGGFIETVLDSTAATEKTIVYTVGDGGNGGRYTSSNAQMGQNTTITYGNSATTLTATGGGLGGNIAITSGGSGGSSGGTFQSTVAPAANVTNQGFKGGRGSAGGASGGGGGGCSGEGFWAPATNTGGNGGIGRISNIFKEAFQHCGGGGGAVLNTGTAPGTGVFGGGSGCNSNGCTGTAGTAETGGGGGGATYPSTEGTGGKGGSGVIIFSYIATDTTPPKNVNDIVLDNTTNCQNISVSYTNPTDADFYQSIWYENNVLLSPNQSNSTTNFNRGGLLSDTLYTYSAKTKDLLGNTNNTWVNKSALTGVCPTPGPTPTETVVVPVYSNQWCGINNLYFSDVRNDNTSYGTLLNYAQGSYNTDENITVQAGDKPKLIDAYLSLPGSPGASLLLAGLRQYNIYGYVSSTSQPSYYTFNVSKINQTGHYTNFYNVSSVAISSTAVTMDKSYVVTSQNITFMPTDRLLIEIYGYTTRASPTTIHFVNGGTMTASYVQSGYFVCSGGVVPPSVVVYSWRRIA